MTALSERQADEGWCCREECCGPGSWCCSHANPDHRCSGDDELPGMWEHADFLGGATDDFCTGVSATWCPVHGDCTCPRDRPDGDIDFAEGEHTCPLHAWCSPHAEHS